RTDEAGEEGRESPRQGGEDFTSEDTDGSPEESARTTESDGAGGGVRQRAGRWATALGHAGLALGHDPGPDELIAAVCHETVPRAELGRTLIVCECREDCEGVQIEFLDVSGAGVDWARCLPAVVYPSRTKFDPESGLGNCKKIEEVADAKELGLPPT